jgi:peptidoglycan/LPS O-acetylase OafA/YrhL
MREKEKFRFASLDCLRGIFASMVVFHHMVDYTSSAVIHNNFFAYSNLFVDFFFVLSGFVISYSYPAFRSRSDLAAFYRKRVLRLYPLHVLLLLVFVAFEFAKYYAGAYIRFNGGAFNENNFYSFLTSALLLNSVKWPFVHSLSWNYPSWSISAEMISYCFYGLIGLGLYSYGRQLFRTFVFLGNILIGFGILYLVQGNFNLIFTYDYGFIRGMIGFSAGVLCFTVFKALYEKAKTISIRAFTIAEIIALLLTFVLVWNWDRFSFHGYIYEVLFFASILIFAFGRGAVSKFLVSVPFFTNLGKYSYSIYMNHAIIGILFNVLFIRLLKLPETSYAYLFLLNFLAVYFISKWTFYHVEVFFQKKLGRQAKKAIIREDQKLTL